MRDNYSDKAADEAFEEIDADGSGELSATEFKEGILKSNKNINSGLPREWIILPWISSHVVAILSYMLTYFLLLF